MMSSRPLGPCLLFTLHVKIAEVITASAYKAENSLWRLVSDKIIYIENI